MLNWLSQNLATCIVGLILLGAVVIVMRQLIRNRQEGRTTCSSSCSGCAMAGSCHKPPKDGT